MRILLALLALTACHDERIAVVLPDYEGATAMIVAVEQENTLWVYARELEPGAPIELPVALPPSGDGRIDILTYERSLESMRIAAGTLERADAEPTRPLPEPFRHYVINVDDGAASTPDLGESDDLLAAFRIAGEPEPPPDAPHCLTLSGDQIDLLGERMDGGWSGFEIALSSTVVLIGTSNHELFRVGAEVERVPFDPPDPLLTAGSMDEGGQLWFADTAGSLWRGTLDRTLHLELVATSTIGPIDVLSASQSNAYAIVLPIGVPEGVLYRFEAGSWRRIYAICTAAQCDLENRFALERLGPEDVLALEIRAPDRRRLLIRHHDGILDTIPIPISGKVSSVAQVEGFGVLIGGEGGVLKVQPDWTIESLTDLAGIEVYALARFGDGVLVGARRGVITQIVPDIRSCSRDLLVGTDVVRFVPLGDAVIAVGRPSFTANALPITVIRGE